MTTCYFAVGTTLANMVNVETLVTDPPTVLPNLHMPLLGGVKRRSLDGYADRSGWLASAWLWEFMSYADWRALIYGTVGSFTIPSKQLYVTTVTEEGYYAPFRVYLDKPHPAQEWGARNSAFTQPVTVTLNAGILQSATKTSNYTVTTSDRLIYANTASGNITLALPAANSVVVNTVYSFHKTSASNTLTLDPNSTELINGASTLALTALNARVDIVSDGSAWTSVSA